MLAGSRTVTGLASVLAAAAVATACTAPATGSTHEDARSIALLRSVVDEDHDTFVDELRRQGWHAGRDVRLRPGDPTEVYGSTEEARAMLRSWHAEDPLDLIVAFSTPYAQLAIEEFPEVPTLFLVNDPVAAGLLHDTDAPDGNATGVSFWTPADRTLALAERAIGDLERVGYLAPEDDPAVPGHRAEVLEAARQLEDTVVEAQFRERDADSIAAAVDELAAAEVDAVWLPSANATLRSVPLLRRELERQGLPAVANTDHAAFAVVVVTPDGAELRRQLGRQAARLLAGAPPSSVPVEAPRRFTVILNASEARALDLPELPRDLVRQADLVR